MEDSITHLQLQGHPSRNRSTTEQVGANPSFESAHIQTRQSVDSSAAVKLRQSLEKSQGRNSAVKTKTPADYIEETVELSSRPIQECEDEFDVEVPTKTGSKMATLRDSPYQNTDQGKSKVSTVFQSKDPITLT